MDLNLINIFTNSIKKKVSPPLNEIQQLRLFIKKKFKYNPKQIMLFKSAFTHRSAADNDKTLESTTINFHKTDSINERLEFLGDAVMDLVVTDYIFKKYPDSSEGDLSKLRSQIVNTAFLATLCRNFELESQVIIGDFVNIKDIQKSDAVTADLFEAVMGAMYLDAGYTYVRYFVEKEILNKVDINALIENDKNYKSILLELVQSYHMELPKYVLLEEKGTSYDKCFVVGISMNNEMIGVGSGKTKKAAEQEAAYQAIAKFKKT